MSKTQDKRRRTDLDVFVLALIADGVATPYELKQHAGLSPGATIPTLDRLLLTGMVRRGKPGARGRIEFRVTRAGAKSLATCWKELLDIGPSGDLEGDLRVALLALWIGGDRKAAADFLKLSARRTQQSMETKKRNHVADRPTTLAGFYRELLSASTTALLEGESIAKLEMAKAILGIRISKRATKRPK